MPRPPLPPRNPATKSPLGAVRDKNGGGSSSPSSSSSSSPSIMDPTPEHLTPLPPLEGDLAESRELDSDTVEVSSITSNNNENTLHGNDGNGPKKSFSWRGKSKVSSTDVASVGGHSDTGIQYSKSSGSIVSTTGRALHERAKMALNAANYALALELFQAILEAQVKRFGQEHASVAAAMHNVGVCRQRMGQYSAAEELLANAVAIREKTSGKYHVEVAASLSKLGSVRISLGKFEEAFMDLRQALSIAKATAAREQSLDKDKTVAQMLCHLACLYFEKGELFAAQATFQDALDIYRQVWNSLVNGGAAGTLGNKEPSSCSPVSPTSTATDLVGVSAATSPNNNNTIDNASKSKNALMLQLTDTLCNIGSILNRRKCFAQAVRNFQEALDLQRGILEHDHPRIISTLDNLAYSYSKNKEYARAITCYRTMLRAQVSQSGQFSEECWLTFRKRIVMYEKLKAINEAINDTKDVLRLQKSYLPKDSTITLETKALLDELQLKKKREQERKQNNRSGSSGSSSISETPVSLLDQHHFPVDC